MSSSAIAVSGLRKAYGDKVVLDGIDFEVATGSVFSLLGPNGAGKTTTVNVLATLLKADAGRASAAIDEIVSGIQRVGSQQAEINDVTADQTRSVRDIAAVVDQVAGSIGGIGSATRAIRAAAAALAVDASELDKLVASDDDA